MINESLDNICEYIDNHIDDFNSILKLNGYDLVVNNIENYDITIDSVDGNFDGKILFINSKEFYFTIGEGLILYDYGFYASDLMYKYAKNGQLIFNVITGYFYRDGDSIVSLNGYDSNCEYLCGNDHYEGQATNMSGAGGIENPDLYIKTRYGDGWILDSENTLTYRTNSYEPYKRMEGFEQNNYNCYYWDDRAGNQVFEGNCCVVAPFTVARYILRKLYSYTNYAYANVELYDPRSEERDYFLSKNIVDEGAGNYLEPESNRRWCELYRRIRRTAYQEFGKTEYLTIFQSSAVLEKVMNHYYITVDANENVDWGCICKCV
ncbi:MAG: hypothetical protein IJU60_05455 [Acholeplasmatales bacterium]|nr:hypothetical protein [Acholeplasmatales bacterium]